MRTALAICALILPAPAMATCGDDWRQIGEDLVEHGRGDFERPGSWLWSACHGHPDRPKALQGFVLRHERILYRDEPIAIALQEREGREGLVSVLRFEDVILGVVDDLLCLDGRGRQQEGREPDPS